MIPRWKFRLYRRRCTNLITNFMRIRSHVRAGGWQKGIKDWKTAAVSTSGRSTALEFHILQNLGLFHSSMALPSDRRWAVCPKMARDLAAEIGSTCKNSVHFLASEHVIQALHLRNNRLHCVSLPQVNLKQPDTFASQSLSLPMRLTVRSHTCLPAPIYKSSMQGWLFN